MEDVSDLASRLLSGVSDEMIADAAGFREETVILDETPRASIESTPLPADWRATISPAGYAFIVRWETGGKSYYERVIKGRPIWPGFASGITIGCGFDLGYHTLAGFTEQWRTRLGATDFQRLSATIGFKTMAPNREGKVARAKALVRSLSDIVVPWDVAIEQFDNAKYPDILNRMYRALDNLDRLHPHCRAALLSLTFNRGPAFSAQGDRFREMRDIRAALTGGTPADFARIPALFRSMVRIWGAESSLAERRKGEAELFQAGLNEAALVIAVQPEAAADTSFGFEAAAAPLSEKPEGIEAQQTDIAEAEEAEAPGFEFGPQIEAAGLTEASVKWNPRDDEQPDYRHLDTALAGTSFELRPEDLDLLIQMNDYAPLPGKLLFGLRGASLGGVPKREDAPSIQITDQRPDHRAFRCVIGVYDQAAKRLWAYQSSTVPNAHFVFKCFAQSRAGVPIRDLTGNCLPTGCYTYTVGTHRVGQPGEIPTVLRLSISASGASEVLVLRSIGDVMYDRFDPLPNATPADNIHPGQLSTGFSSAGCLTLPGFFRNGQHSGIWKDFRAAAGIGSSSNGVQFSMLLFTGLDAALAASVRNGMRDADELRRLRHGSKGSRVAALQAALGLAPDTTQRLGPVTRGALVKRQAAKLGWADGIYSPAMDELLGLQIYAQA